MMKLKTSYKVGDTVRIGDVDYIIAHEDTDKDITYLICKYWSSTENAQFNPDAGQPAYEVSVIYEKCKTWYQEKIPNEVKQFLITPECGHGCPVFIPTSTQIADTTKPGYTFHGTGEWSHFKDDESRRFKNLSGKSCSWWLQDTHPTYPSDMFIVGHDGGIHYGYPSGVSGFRPCLAIYTDYLAVISNRAFRNLLMQCIDINHITEGSVWFIGEYLYDIIETTAECTVLAMQTEISEVIKTIDSRREYYRIDHPSESEPMTVWQLIKDFVDTGLFLADEFDPNYVTPVLIPCNDQGECDSSTIIDISPTDHYIDADGMVWYDDVKDKTDKQKVKLGIMIITKILIAKDILSELLVEDDERFHYACTREYLQNLHQSNAEHPEG